MNTKPIEFNSIKGKRAYGDPVLNGKVIDLGNHDIFLKEISGFLKSIKENTSVPFDPYLALRDLIAVKDIYKNKI